MPDWIASFLSFFSLSEVGLPAIFVVAFLSATVLPLATEPVLFGFVSLNPSALWWAIMVATVGNTLGGMVTYGMGWGAKSWLADARPSVRLRWLQQLGAPVLLLSWLPLLGDALCAMAGWLKLPWQSVLFWMALGKFIRFVVLTFALLSIPHSFWSSWIQGVLP